MCPSCFSERATTRTECPRCRSTLVERGASRRETRSLWAMSTMMRVKNKAKRDRDSQDRGPRSDAPDDQEKIVQYKDLIRTRVLESVARSRHLTASDIRILFHECFPPSRQPACTCESDNERRPLCARCSPVLTVMRLLARNPRPLMASLGERAVPGRALSRTYYDKPLLTTMLNDKDLPICPSGHSCKGLLVKGTGVDPLPLPALISPESYRHLVTLRAETAQVIIVEPCRCLLCLLFNQSARVAQMFSSRNMNLESQPNGDVYYFNIKLAPTLAYLKCL
ncbi:hypothetical protein WMY93_031122 [Mugilogobius chulae]|uniref:Uncharacterized protein n=1 Tax=Mugilogobius chulae TaxID=88201 RepID=A0AAW0ME67_9GOBI